MSNALVHGQLMLVELPSGDAFPLIVITIQCEICGDSTMAIAAHHAKSVFQALADCIAELPDEASGAEGTRLPITRPRKPENN
jgi:hypothetical protein